MRVSANMKSVTLRAMLVATAVAALAVGITPAQAQTLERQTGDAFSTPVVHYTHYTGHTHTDDDGWD